MHPPDINWLYIPFLLTFLQGLITAFSIFKSKQNTFLALLLVFISFGALTDTGLFADNLVAELLWNGNEFLFGPLLFLAVHQQLSITIHQKYIHFIIFGLMKLLLISGVVSSAVSNAISPRFSLLLSIVLYIHGLSYTVYCLFQLYKKEQPIHPKERTWLRWLVWMFLVGWILALSAKISTPIDMFGTNSLFYFAYIVGFVAVYYISYHIADRIFPTIAVSGQDQSQTIESGAAEIKKYSKSSLGKEQIDAYQKAVMAFFEKDKPYLNVDFSFRQLSEKLNINSHHLSQTFNEAFGKTYPQLIKELRIKEAAKRIVDEQYAHLSVYGIALDCGFNSKSAFNQAFKEITRSTPSEYKKKRIG